MKNVIKKIASIAMAFTLLGTGTVVTKTVVPQSDNTITAYADVTVATVGSQPYRVTLKNPKSWLNVRKGPGTGYSIVGKRNHGKIVYVYAINEKNGNWALIGNNQWVCMSYLTKVFL